MEKTTKDPDKIVLSAAEVYELVTSQAKARDAQQAVRPYLDALDQANAASGQVMEKILVGHGFGGDQRSWYMNKEEDAISLISVPVVQNRGAGIAAILASPVTDLDLPGQTTKVLVDHHLTRIGQLTDMTAAQLAALKGIGVERMRLLTLRLEDRGLGFRPEDGNGSP